MAAEISTPAMSARSNSPATHPPGQPYLRWHHKDAPRLRRLRLKLEALLGGACSYCGLSRADGVNLQFHHHQGRDWVDKHGRPLSPRKLSWCMRLTRYKQEIKAGTLLYLACDQTGNNCHERCKREAPSQPQKLYDYPPAPKGSAKLQHSALSQPQQLYEYDPTNSPF